MLKFRFRLTLIFMGFLFIISCKKDNEPESPQKNGYNIASLSATGNTLNTNNQTDNARGIHLIGDTLLFVHSRGTNSVVSYTISNPKDLTTASYLHTFSVSNFIGTTNQGANGHGIYIKYDDLSKMWLFKRTEIWEFNLTQPGNISTAEYSNYLDLSEYIERGHGIYFKPDGSQLYIDDRNKELIHQFELNQNWSINEITNYKNLDISSTQEAVRAVVFHPNGNKLYLLDTQLKEIHQFDLSTPWQVESATFSKKKSLNISNPRGFTWNSDGTRAYIMNTDNGVIVEYGG